MKRVLFLLICFLIAAGNAQASELSAQANVLYAQNSIDKAFDLLVIIPDEERTAQDYLLMGNILQDKGKNDEAAFMYESAILENPKYYKAYYNLGLIRLQEEKPNMAIAEFKKAIKLAPEFSYAYYNLGCAYLKLGENGKARTEFLRAIAIKNTVPEYHYNLAYAYKKLKNDKKAALYLGYYNKLVQ
jgi:tetratricopeptide (TPR) repeat protein